MSLHEEIMDRAPVQRSQATVGTQNDKKQIHRLYPSLPDIESFVTRHEGDKLESSSGEMLHGAAVCLPENLLENTKSHMADSTMKAQIVILEAQRRELLRINEKWAKEYQTMVQYYKEKVCMLRTLLQHNRGQNEEDERGKYTGLCKDVNFKPIKDKEGAWGGNDDDVISELLKAEKEAKMLRAQNSTLTRRGQHQQEEIRRLNKALEESLQITQPLGEGGEPQEVWRHQAEVYKEDFLKERQDREKLKEKHLELEKKFRKVHNELKSQMTCTCKNRDECPAREGHVYSQLCPKTQQHGQFQHKPH
ncbi:hypothetical protein LDENG_00050790 [Lucifuga dentata]|nr:hypothetical protein LDENG_00050790 [Lucifuga dentata]